MREISKLFGIAKSELKHLENISCKQEEEIREIYSYVLSYFGSRESTRDWFKAKNRGLGSVTPLILLKDESGIERIRTSINKLRYGMTS
tara:strand:+ start:21458 stop:21724 length:267 start_codon:yes stop_codon:yes gene_type:complete